MAREIIDPVNADKFADLMFSHYTDAGVNCLQLWLKTKKGEDIRPLARTFIIDRLSQCFLAWECAEGVWRTDAYGCPERDHLSWDWDKFVKDIREALDEVI